MKSEESRPDVVSEYQDLLKLLTLTGKYLEGIRADPVLLKSYSQLLRYLRSRSPECISEILAGTRRPTQKPTTKPALSDAEICGLSFEDILRLASNPAVPRLQLERIAVVRFSVTRGALTELRSRDALVEKLRTLIANASTHESITRAAGQHGEGAKRSGS